METVIIYRISSILILWK